MKKRIRPIAMILSHVGLLLSILYLIFFLVCTIKADSAKNSSDEKDLYLNQAISERDFSIYTVGKALSDRTDPGFENVLVGLDLVIPVLFLSSGILLQVATVRTKKKRPAKPQASEQSNATHRR